MRTLASVDLPEPFGPISACVSPCLTVRSIPFRIGLSSTVASRASISSVAGSAMSVALRDLDHHVVALDLGREHLDRLGGGQRGRPARVEVEGRAVLGTLDRLVVDVDLALVKEIVCVRADRIHHAEALVPEVRDREGPVVELEPAHLALGNLAHAADPHERHLAIPPAISSSIARSRPSRISAMSTRSSTSAKKPNTIRRSASFSGMPRLIR